MPKTARPGGRHVCAVCSVHAPPFPLFFPLFGALRACCPIPSPATCGRLGRACAGPAASFGPASQAKFLFGQPEPQDQAKDRGRVSSSLLPPLYLFSRLLTGRLNHSLQWVCYQPRSSGPALRACWQAQPLSGPAGRDQWSNGGVRNVFPVCRPDQPATTKSDAATSRFRLAHKLLLFLSCWRACHARCDARRPFSGWPGPLDCRAGGVLSAPGTHAQPHVRFGRRSGHAHTRADTTTHHRQDAKDGVALAYGHVPAPTLHTARAACAVELDEQQCSVCAQAPAGQPSLPRHSAPCTTQAEPSRALGGPPLLTRGSPHPGAPRISCSRNNNNHKTGARQHTQAHSPTRARRSCAAAKHALRGATTTRAAAVERQRGAPLKPLAHVRPTKVRPDGTGAHVAVCLTSREGGWATRFSSGGRRGSA